MARPKKEGIDYFSFDVDFFQDEKISAIAGEFGMKGEMAVIKLLCAIYRNGYFAEWTDLLRMKMLKELPGVSADLLDKIVSRLARWGFFDKDLFENSGILTSKGIQRRYLEAVKRRNVKVGELPYFLVNVCNNPVNVCNNSPSSGVNVCNNPQSKVNESKVNPPTPQGGKQERVCDSDSLPANQNPFPTLIPKIVNSLQPFVCKELERFFASKAKRGVFFDEIQQENILYKMFPYEPAEQVKIIGENIDNGHWKAFYIPDKVKDMRLARVKKQESERASKLALENWKKQTEEEPPCET